ENVALQLVRRISFRRAMKKSVTSALRFGALGIKIACSGRLGGAEMSRKFVTREGSIPLSTLQANVDYASATSFTTYGAIGVKVWIYKGMFTEAQEDQTESKAAGARARARGRR
ncbi:MAG: 30S ribosomal protein S3, partial [Pirellulaceae bacterium]|nr:30S ribosomal protein S3 [Pirellulaceae bacterium]